jgi:hypothetical protein
MTFKTKQNQNIEYLKKLMNEIKLSWYDPDKRKEVPRKLGVLNDYLSKFINKKINEINRRSTKL